MSTVEQWDRLILLCETWTDDDVKVSGQYCIPESGGSEDFKSTCLYCEGKENSVHCTFPYQTGPVQVINIPTYAFMFTAQDF